MGEVSCNLQESMAESERVYLWLLYISSCGAGAGDFRAEGRV